MGRAGIRTKVERLSVGTIQTIHPKQYTWRCDKTKPETRNRHYENSYN